MIPWLICTGLFLASAEGSTTPDALAAEVGRLVRQLDAAQLTERDDAERRLLALGPNVLPLLPAINDRTPAEVALRVTRLRQQMLRAQAAAATQASRVTLRGENLPLAGVLAEISKQSGNPITDYREKFGQRADELRVTVDFDKTPFWKALDHVLDQAGLTLYGFAGQRGAFVVSRPGGTANRAAKASYAGMFRLEPLRFEAQRDLGNEELGGLRFFMEVSWEPRLQPFAILQPLADVSAVGDSRESIVPASRQAEPETLIRQGFSTTQLEIPFVLPKRGTEKIDVLKGKLLALVPGPLVDFRFDQLPLSRGNARAKAVEQRQGGTLVTLDEVRKNNDAWAVNLRIRFEAPSRALESHRGWILENQAFFQDSKGNRIQPGGLEQTMHTKDEIGINYIFDLPGGPQDLTFVYRTPLVVLELPLEYEFRDLRLP
ncbi:MAG: hypothetical protein WDZ48_02730 [Pirellulales bacterium]